MLIFVCLSEIWVFGEFHNHLLACLLEDEELNMILEYFNITLHLHINKFLESVGDEQEF
jgi:hypothetical protein